MAKSRSAGIFADCEHGYTLFAVRDILIMNILQETVMEKIDLKYV